MGSVLLVVVSLSSTSFVVMLNTYVVVSEVDVSTILRGSELETSEMSADSEDKTLSL